jgi:hypothetical protein
VERSGWRLLEDVENDLRVLKLQIFRKKANNRETLVEEAKMFIGPLSQGAKKVYLR